jgi:hypothetical protein
VLRNIDNDGPLIVAEPLRKAETLFTTPTAWTVALNTESTYDWRAEEWSVPINLMLSKLVHFGKQPVSFQGGIRYWADSTDAGPEDWGARFAVTFLFPK